MRLTVDSLIEINNIIISENNITLRKNRFYKIYIDKELIEDKLYQIIDTSVKELYSIHSNKIH